MKKLFITPAIIFIMMFSILNAQVLTNDMSNLAKIQSNLKSKRISSHDTSGGNGDCYTKIKDKEKRTILDLKGAGIIKHIWITIAPFSDKISRNDIILRMFWDGKDYPSVESPIGPFFGQGWTENYLFSSLPLCAAPAGGNGLVCYFQMPFSNGARFEIENQAGIDIESFYFNIDYVEMDKLPADLGRFHAWYNHELTDALADGENEWSVLGAQGKNKSGEANYLIANITGTGHFAGVNYYVHSPSPMWYGEGDEMVFIDGEKYPSIIGTGTEDYFNSSWCPKEIYNHPYFGYVRINNETGWLGRTHCYRFHISDPIYFQKSLKFTIEHGHNNCLTLDMASVAYWYQSEASKLPPIPSKEARKPKPFIGAWEIIKWRDAWRIKNGKGSKLWGNE